MLAAANCRRVSFPLLIVVLALAAAPCLAVSMHVTAGFNGTAKTWFWTPIAVKLSNPTDDNIEGFIEVGQPDAPRDPLPLCTTRVNLPGHSTKLYHVYVRLSGYSTRLEVNLWRGYSILAAKEVKVQSLAEASTDSVIVTVGSRTSRLSFLQGESINMAHSQHGASMSPVGGPGTIHAGTISPDELPDRPAGLEGADVIVANGLSPDTVDPKALEALCVWVASGNTLVISTGADYRSYMNPFYDELLPVKISGAASIPAMPSLVSFAPSVPPFPPSPVALAKGTPKSIAGSVLSSASGVPVVVARQYGAGRVIFLAFDHRAAPFKDWNGQTQFWKTIIERGTNRPIVETNLAMANDQYGVYEDTNGGLFATVTQNPSIKTPSISAIGLFLLAYLVVLVPVNYAVLRKRRRLEWAWVTTPAIVLLFALGAYAIGYTMKGGDLRLSECTVVQGASGERYARAVTDACLFSPARRSYNLSVSNPTALSQVVATSREDLPAETYLGETTSIDRVGIPMWASKTFEAVGGVDLGGCIDSNLRMSGGHITGTITNNTNIDLRDCKVYYGNSSSDSIRLGKGQARQIDVVIGSGGPPPRPPDPYNSDADVRIRLLSFGDSAASSQGEPTLVAFADPGDGVFGIPDDRFRAERAACYLFRLSYGMGESVSISPAMAAFSRTSGPADVRSAAGGMKKVDMYPGNFFEGSFRLPVPGGYKVTSLRLLGSQSTGAAAPPAPAPPPGVTLAPAPTPVANARVVCLIRNCKTGKWDKVTIPSQVSSPGRYLDSESRVTLKVSSNDTRVISLTLGVAAEATRQ